MLSIIKQINFIPVACTVISTVIISILWYMPFLFGKAWSEIIGQSIDGPPEPKMLLTGIICTLFLNLVICIIVKIFGTDNISGALLLGTLMSLFIVSAALPIHVYNAYRMKLFFIDTGLTVFNIYFITIVLTLWK